MAVAGAFYTYIHRRADDGKVFYVGKGKGGRAASDKNRNPHWHRTVLKHGILVEIVARWASDREAFAHEKLLIARYRNDSQPLCNYTDGGDGISGYKHTEVTRAKLSAMQVGKKLSAEHRAKLCAVARKGVPRTAEVREKISRANKGQKHTAEHRRRNSESRLGKRQSAETIAKRVAKLVGRKRSDEARAKISASHVGMKYPAEFGVKISAANKGRVRSAEFKAKISAANIGTKRSAEAREKMSAWQIGKTISQEQRDKISKTLTGRRLPDAEKARLYPLTHSAEIISKRTAAIKGRKLSDAHRAALSKPWSDAARKTHERTMP